MRNINSPANEKKQDAGAAESTQLLMSTDADSTQFAFTKKEGNYQTTDNNNNGGERLTVISEVDSEGEKIPDWKKKRNFSRKHYAWIALASGFFFGNQVFLMQVVVHS